MRVACASRARRVRVACASLARRVHGACVARWPLPHLATRINLKDHKKSVQNANVMHGLYDELSKWSAGSKKKFLVAWTSYELRARKEDFDTNLLYNALADLETKSAYDKVCSSHPDL